jgi:hypothetical protein
MSKPSPFDWVTGLGRISELSSESITAQTNIQRTEQQKILGSEWLVRYPEVTPESAKPQSKKRPTSRQIAYYSLALNTTTAHQNLGNAPEFHCDL